MVSGARALRVIVSAVAAATFLAMPAAHGAVTSKATSPCTKGKTPQPQDPRSSVYLQGNASPSLSPGDPRKIAVLGTGPQVVNFGLASNSVALVIRNNTCSLQTHVDVTATVRSPGGQIVASANSQGIEPATLTPGQVGIGHLYLGSTNQLPAGIQYTFSTAGQKSLGVLKDYLANLQVTQTNSTIQQQFSTTTTTIVGTVVNPRKVSLQGPFAVDVVCFDPSGAILSERTGFANSAGDALAPGATASFSIDFINSPCPIYLVGASGFDRSALQRTIRP